MVRTGSFGNPLFQVSTTDGGKREVQLQFRHLSGDPGSEGVAVRAWKGPVGSFPWISVCRLVYCSNQFVYSRSFVRFKNPGLLTVPISIGDVSGYPQDRLAMVATPADHVVNRIGGFTGPLGSNPGVDGKPAAPTPGIGAVDVKNRLVCGCGIGRDPGRFATGGSPIFSRINVHCHHSNQDNSRQQDYVSHGRVLHEITFPFKRVAISALLEEPRRRAQSPRLVGAKWRSSQSMPQGILTVRMKKSTFS